MNPHTSHLREKSKYCSFHKDVDHTTENCIPFKKIIERLVLEGHLKEYTLEALPTESSKGKERVIEVITPEVPSITKI